MPGNLLRFSILLFALHGSPVFADSIETVFRDAARYTVKIKTTTEYPYLTDDLGTTFGAGFLVDKKRGWILTNRHVVAVAPSTVEVRFIDNVYLPAEKIYMDPQVDLALIRIPTESIPENAIAADLACFEQPQMGNSVVIFGHPSGLNFTGTRGIISGTTFVEGNESLQTDAPQNSGNSGGPLINVDTGKVVGVSEATFDSKNSEGLNLTVSIDHACKIISLIEDERDPSPASLPIVFMEYNSDWPQLIVANAYYADKSLLRTGDIILRLQGSEAKITNVDHLLYQLRGVEKPVRIVVQRNEKEMVVELPLQRQPSLLEQTGLTFSGMTLLDFSPIDKSENGDQNSVYVVHVADGTPADNAWFEIWDSIYSVNGSRVYNIEDINRQLQSLNDSGDVANIVVRVKSKRLRKLYNYHELVLEVRGLRFLAH
ncbi:MAG: PDZ domain-containing protein [Gammaproteobacteria bacterium]|nr:PDZ domain-containing protein [Gammaproteobacteria bacterium]